MKSDIDVLILFFNSVDHPQKQMLDLFLFMIMLGYSLGYQEMNAHFARAIPSQQGH